MSASFEDLDVGAREFNRSVTAPAEDSKKIRRHATDVFHKLVGRKAARHRSFRRCSTDPGGAHSVNSNQLAFATVSADYPDDISSMESLSRQTSQIHHLVDFMASLRDGDGGDVNMDSIAFRAQLHRQNLLDQQIEQQYENWSSEIEEANAIFFSAQDLEEESELSTCCSSLSSLERSQSSGSASTEFFHAEGGGIIEQLKSISLAPSSISQLRGIIRALATFTYKRAWCMQKGGVKGSGAMAVGMICMFLAVRQCKRSLNS